MRLRSFLVYAGSRLVVRCWDSASYLQRFRRD